MVRVEGGPPGSKQCISESKATAGHEQVRLGMPVKAGEHTMPFPDVNEKKLGEGPWWKVIADHQIRPPPVVFVVRGNVPHHLFTCPTNATPITIPRLMALHLKPVALAPTLFEEAILVLA